MLESIVKAIEISLVEVWVGFGNTVVNILIALIIFALICGISILLAKFVKKVIVLIRVDSLFEKIRLIGFLEARGFSFTFSGLVAWIVKWTGVFGAIAVFLRLLNLQTSLIYLNALGGFAIKGVSAGVILAIGFFVAGFIKQVLAGLAKLLQLPENVGNWVSGFIKWGIITFTFVFALSEFQISQALLKNFLTAFLAMIALAGGIALGLSGKAWADRIIEKMRKDVEE